MNIFCRTLEFHAVTRTGLPLFHLQVARIHPSGQLGEPKRGCVPVVWYLRHPRSVTCLWTSRSSSSGSLKAKDVCLKQFMFWFWPAAFSTLKLLYYCVVITFTVYFWNASFLFKIHGSLCSPWCFYVIWLRVGAQLAVETPSARHYYHCSHRKCWSGTGKKTGSEHSLEWRGGK